MDANLEQFVVSELSKHRSRNEIVRAICERGGFNWPQAEQLVQQVEQQQARTIARKQSPLLIFLSIATLIIGLLMLWYSAEFFAAFVQGQPLEQLLSARSAYYRIAGGLTGIGMVAGGLIGAWKTVTPLLAD